MIKILFNIIKCKIISHSFVLAGTCPVTEKTYNVCTKCTKIIKVDKPIE